MLKEEPEPESDGNGDSDSYAGKGESRQMSLFDFLDDDKDDGGDDEWCTQMIIVMPVGGQLFRTFREIATIHSREMAMNDVPAYVIL